jgi:hypothetical protein
MAQNQARQPGWPDPRTRDAGAQRAPQHLTDDERRESAAFARHSLGLTHALFSDALWVPCPTHAAERGSFCWENPRSGVRGLCMARMARGVRDASRVVKHMPEPPHAILHQFVSRPVAQRSAR